MTRQEQFRAEMSALLAKYKVEISVEESDTGWHPTATGISFWSYAEYDQDGTVTAGLIDFCVGTRGINSEDFDD